MRPLSHVIVTGNPPICDIRKRQNTLTSERPRPVIRGLNYIDQKEKQTYSKIFIFTAQKRRRTCWKNNPPICDIRKRQNTLTSERPRPVIRGLNYIDQKEKQTYSKMTPWRQTQEMKTNNLCRPTKNRCGVRWILPIQSKIQQQNPLPRDMTSFRNCEKVDANEWLNLDQNDFGYQILNDDEILTVVTDNEAPVDEDDGVTEN
ncbi:uncharacterized protein [Periplaneta americana]|uniref:uncharacterized protein n=1 Tax=Periplaneta americana TaxID=6978 RepID=UPI0037E7E530